MVPYGTDDYQASRTNLWDSTLNGGGSQHLGAGSPFGGSGSQIRGGGSQIRGAEIGPI